MKTQRFTAIVLALQFSTAAMAQGLIFPGGRGLTHLHSAWTLDKGSVTLTAYTTSFYKPVIYQNPSTGSSTITYWDIQGAVGINFSTSKHLEFNVTNILYQDTHRDAKGYNFPSDFSLSLKLASYGNVQSHFRFGAMLEGKIPTAKHHNVYLEPYSAGKFEVGIFGLVSYSTDLLIPEAGFNAHFNIGFWHHNDTGARLTANPNDPIAVLGPTRQMLWGIGAVWPRQQVDFGLEVFGNFFLVRPPVTAYSREDYVYITPSVTFRPSGRISFMAGVDIRATTDYDHSKYTFDGTSLMRIDPNLPNYPSWRARIGARIHLTRPLPREVETPLFSQEDFEEGRPQKPEVLASKIPLQEQLVKERRETELAEEELERIRSDRRKMEEMLARLRQILRYGKEVTPPDSTQKKEGDEKEKPSTKKN